MRILAVLFLSLAVVLTGCGSHFFKHFEFEFTERSFPWGNIAIWTLGTSVREDDHTTTIGPPYRLVVELKMHGQVSECSVGINSVRLMQADTGKTIVLETPKDEKLIIEAPKTGIPRLMDNRDWYSTYFGFDKLQLEFVDYKLSLNYIFKGNCGKAEGGSVSIPFKKHYVETSDAIWYQ